MISQGLWQLVATLTEFVPSIAMQQIIDFVSAYEKEGGAVTERVTFFVVLLFVGPIVQGLADGRNFHIGRRIGCRVRGSLVGSIFRKMLAMDTASSTYSSGQLTNLMSVDAQSVLEYSCYTHFIWATSLQASLVFCGTFGRGMAFLSLSCVRACRRCLHSHPFFTPSLGIDERKYFLCVNRDLLLRDSGHRGRWPSILRVGFGRPRWCGVHGSERAAGEVDDQEDAEFPEDPHDAEGRPHVCRGRNDAGEKKNANMRG